MKLSTRVRYGTRFLVNLAAHYKERQVFLTDIAREEGISQKYLSQIVIPLKNSGMITSFRGMKGGYSLARSPADITIREIIEALEGDLSMVCCVVDAARCPRSGVCATHLLWKEIGERIAQTLQTLTLEDVVRMGRRNQTEGSMYHI